MTKIIVDGKEIDVPPEYTLLQACEAAGAEIPRFCFHERLSIAGNCRMCLIEVAGIPKPQASCAMGVKDLPPNSDGTPKVINTKTPMVKKAREGVMEFLLINHPLDCPICDQGGECDLQDQAMAYGVDASRYKENKRAVEEKYIGPLVKTIMTRCIHCTRCIRFSTEIAGVPELGAIGRGEDMEITTYLEHAMTSELQSNVVDLCPVGALTSKPYAFAARPWELSKTQSVDVMDALGSAIRIDTRGREVMRILPRGNDDVNEEWISDKTRHVVDGLRTQRLDQPYLRVNGRLQPASWKEAFAAIAAKVKAADAKRIGAIAGDLAAVEDMFALKDLMTRLGSGNIDARQDGSALEPKWGRASYLFNATIAGIERADALADRRFQSAARGAGAQCPHPQALARRCLSDRRHRREGRPHLQIRLPRCRRRNLGGVGDEQIRRSAESRRAPAHPRRRRCAGAQRRRRHRRARRQDGVRFRRGERGLERLLGFAQCRLARGRARSRLGAGRGWQDRRRDGRGWRRRGVPARRRRDRGLARTFRVYIGTHGDRGAHRADVILPGAAYPEKSALYVNTEGRVQMANRAGFPPGDAREDWAILRALSDALGHKLPYDALSALRQALFAAHPHFMRIDQIAAGDAADIEKLARLGGKPDKAPLGSSVADFYLTNPIARASAIMAECSGLAHAAAKNPSMTAAE